MLTLSTQYCHSELIGEAHGLDIDELFACQATAVAEGVQQLVANADKDGAWSRWLTLGEQTQLADDIQAYADKVKGQFDDVVVLGIGGSALGAKALFNALCHPQWNMSDSVRQGRPRLHVVDNVDSDALHGLLETVDLTRTLILAISKSGTTIEPMSALLLVMAAWKKAGITQADWAKYLVMVTDPEKGLFRPFANKHGLTCFDVPDDVGGRFSVFCAVGLLPAALVGIDIRAMQAGIQAIMPALTNPDIHQNPAAQAAVVQMAYLQSGKPISVMMPYSKRLEFVADWYVQLWAESLGKADSLTGETINVGPTPVKAVGATDQHSQLQLFQEGPYDKVVTFIEVAESDHALTITDVPPEFASLGYLAGHQLHDILLAELKGTRESLAEANRPTMTVTLPSVTPASLAQLLTFFMVQTAIAGHLLGIDPFNQPGVEGSKRITKALLNKASAVPA